jgi:hypothetical protein
LPAGALRVADLGFFDLGVFAQMDANKVIAQLGRHGGGMETYGPVG